MKKLINYIFILLFFFILVFGFWNKFVRERLPKYIPFDLSILKFALLLIICIGLSLSIIFLIWPSKKTNLFTFLTNIYKDSITLFINKLLTFKYLENVYEKFVVKSHNFFLKNYYILHFFNIIPRILLMFIFTFDIIHNQIFWTYKFLYLYILIYLKDVIIAHLKILKFNRSEWIENNWEIRINRFTKIVNINDLIILQTNCLTSKKPLIDYGLMMKDPYVKWLVLEFNLTKNGKKLNTKALILDIKAIINLMVETNLILYLYDQLESKDKIVFIIIKIISLIIWIYILLISLPTLDITNSSLTFFYEFHDIIDPFSQISLF